eukprot:SAG31_NODE_3175_length_4586_cov_4.176064_2_plen_128_part_00
MSPWWLVLMQCSIAAADHRPQAIALTDGNPDSACRSQNAAPECLLPTQYEPIRRTVADIYNISLKTDEDTVQFRPTFDAAVTWSGGRVVTDMKDGSSKQRQQPPLRSLLPHWTPTYNMTESTVVMPW